LSDEFKPLFNLQHEGEHATILNGKMPELFHLFTPQQAYSQLDSFLSFSGKVERIATTEALRRVLAEEVFAPFPLPSFPRSAVDGYAVQAEDTYGGSETSPVYLHLIGEVVIGGPTELILSPGEATLIHTGSPLPGRANAVVMVEYTQKVDASTIEVTRPVAVGENVLQIGEDIPQGKTLFHRGHLLRPQDIGGLLAQGITSVSVSQRPRVAIIPSGDELVLPQMEPGVGQVRDINTYSLAALTSQAGGIPLPQAIVEDDFEALREAAEKALAMADIVVISAGSSVGTRDITAQVIDSLGSPGVVVHGIAIKPGKPTILAIAGQKPIFGLPGNPVSAIVTFELFVTPTIYKLSGCNNPPTPHTLSARLTHNIPSVSGREDYIPVRVEGKGGELWVEPIFGKSNFISTLIRADGMVQVPLNKGGLKAGDEVRVRLF
jgi:molybdopterin molybdotransferase